MLGEEKPGQVHGMGLLPVPKQVYGRTTRHFKDINIIIVDGSSSDVETHMLEEIKQTMMMMTYSCPMKRLS